MNHSYPTFESCASQEPNDCFVGVSRRKQDLKVRGRKGSRSVRPRRETFQEVALLVSQKVGATEWIPDQVRDDKQEDAEC